MTSSWEENRSFSQDIGLNILFLRRENKSADREWTHNLEITEQRNKYTASSIPIGCRVSINVWYTPQVAQVKLLFLIKVWI